jgi:hypothetical protein
VLVAVVLQKFRATAQHDYPRAYRRLLNPPRSACNNAPFLAFTHSSATWRIKGFRTEPNFCNITDLRQPPSERRRPNCCWLTKWQTKGIRGRPPRPNPLRSCIGKQYSEDELPSFAQFISGERCYEHCFTLCTCMA